MRLERPERTIQFCTWGGEEEGLYAAARPTSLRTKNYLKENLRLYVNLDMNHVDADASRGHFCVPVHKQQADDLGPHEAHHQPL